MPLLPGMPPDRGGNDPIRAAAQANLQQGMTSAGTDPNQLPQQGPGPSGAPQGQGVGFHLQQALELWVAGKGNPSDTAQIQQFLEAVAAIANQTSQGQAGPPPSQPGVGSIPPQATAQAAPQPGRPL